MLTDGEGGGIIEIKTKGTTTGMYFPKSGSRIFILNPVVRCTILNFADETSEYRLRRRYPAGYRRLARWVHGRWWRPWYDSEDEVPAAEIEEVKALGEELSEELEAVANALDEAETGSNVDEEEEGSEYSVKAKLHRCHRRRLLGLPCLPHVYGHDHRGHHGHHGSHGHRVHHRV